MLDISYRGKNFLAAIWFVLGTQSGLLCQTWAQVAQPAPIQQTEYDAVRNIAVTIRYLPGFQPTYSIGGQVHLTDLARQFSQLKNEDVVAELELTSDQLVGIKSLLNEIDAKNKKLEELLGGRSTASASNDQLAQLKTWVRNSGQELDQRIENSLLPHQVYELRRIDFHNLAWSNGYANALKAVATDLSIEFDDDAYLFVSSQEEQSKQQLKSEIRVFLKEQVEKIIAPLDSQKRARLEAQERLWLEGAMFSPELFIAQLKLLDEEINVPPLNDNWGDVSYWSLSKSGNYRLITQQLPGYSAGFLFGALQSEPLSEAVDLSAIQVEELKSMQSLLSTELEDVFRQFEQKALTETDKGRALAKLNTAAFQQLMDNVLVPEQARRVEAICLAGRIRRYGLAFELVNGQLGKRLEVSDLQRSAIRKASKASTDDCIDFCKTRASRLLAHLCKDGPESRLDPRIPELLRHRFDYITPPIGLLTTHNHKQ